MLEDLDIQSVLLIFISIILIIIFMFVYSELNKADALKDQIGNLKMECPQCPDIKCPDIEIPKQIPNNSCPEVHCPECPNIQCPTCPTQPQCPKCPGVNYPTVKEIVAGIFPGKDPGISLTGGFFPSTTLLNDQNRNIPMSSQQSEVVSMDGNPLLNLDERLDNEQILRDNDDILKIEDGPVVEIEEIVDDEEEEEEEEEGFVNSSMFAFI